ncbi:MAG: hypothetical protein J7539_14675, partial [Niabella sp.]|nr:hypothetical protein [Niabella sp.]
SIYLAESVIKNQTKKLKIELPVEEITTDAIQFIQSNLKAHKGGSILKLSIKDAAQDIQVDLMTRDKGFEMNGELIEYLAKQANWNVAVEMN